MEHNTVKYLRVFVPGFILIIASLPIILRFNESANLLKDYQTIFLGMYPIVAIVIGVFYDIFDGRSILWGKDMEKIQSHIIEEIFKAYKDDSQIYKKSLDRSNFRAIRDFHYSLIDSDKSLTIRSKQIFFNGTVLTTMIDIQIILGFFLLIYLYLFRFTHDLFFLVLLLPAGILITFAYLGRKKAFNKHLKLVSGQIAFYHNDQELSQKVKNKLASI
jgi:hypothetical protein